MSIYHISALVVMGVICLTPSPVSSHGRLWEPPGRTSVFRRYPEYKTAKDYNDNQKFCGGLQRQIANNYKCGVCGDPWNQAIPRDSEVGGKYVNSTWRPVFGDYTSGEKTVLTIEITANHKGWVSFSLCPVNDFGQEATQDCLDQHPLELSEDTRNLLTTSGNLDSHQWLLPDRVGKMDIEVIIPEITCDLCVLQWKYHTGNNWNFNPATGQSEPGVGYQEEFYACADVKITGREENTQKPITLAEVTTTPKITTTTSKTKTTTPRITTTTPKITTTTSKTTTSKTTTTTITTPKTTTTPKTKTTTTLKTTTTPKITQKSTILSTISTTTTSTTSKPTTTTSTTTTTRPTINSGPCVAIGVWASPDGMGLYDKWCQVQCHFVVPFCPAFMCSKKCKK